MEILDALLQLRVPVWLVIALAMVGILSNRYYSHRLDRSKDQHILQLEHRLERQRLQLANELELTRDRHRRRLESLDQVGAALMGFHHAIGHLLRGDNYARDLSDRYTGARTLAREYVGLLGEKYYEAVLKLTDTGLQIRHASFLVTKDALDKLLEAEVPGDVLYALSLHIEIPIPVISGGELVAGIDEETLRRVRDEVFQHCTVSEEFDREAYDEARMHVWQLADEIRRSLPSEFVSDEASTEDS